MKKNFGQWLKETLERKKITQADFARRINMQPSQVSRIISGERGTTIEVIELMGMALGIRPEDVFRAFLGLSESSDDLTPAKRELIYAAENADDAEVEMALAVLRSAAEQKRRK